MSSSVPTRRRWRTPAASPPAAPGTARHTDVPTNVTLKVARAGSTSAPSGRHLPPPVAGPSDGRYRHLPVGGAVVRTLRVGDVGACGLVAGRTIVGLWSRHRLAHVAWMTVGSVGDPQRARHGVERDRGRRRRVRDSGPARRQRRRPPDPGGVQGGCHDHRGTGRGTAGRHRRRRRCRRWTPSSTSASRPRRRYRRRVSPRGATGARSEHDPPTKVTGSVARKVSSRVHVGGICPTLEAVCQRRRRRNDGRGPRAVVGTSVGTSTL